jgi:GMP synthase (glutamine-hydrolysing)
MGIYYEDACPRLRAEKQCIHKAVAAGKRVLGICLGARLIADVLGARVHANAHREIGWFAVHRVPETENTVLIKACQTV